MSDGSKKLPADQISVSSSGSSGSEVEDLSSPNPPACSIRLQVTLQLVCVSGCCSIFLRLIPIRYTECPFYDPSLGALWGALWETCSVWMQSELPSLSLSLLHSLIHVFFSSLQSFHSSCNNVSEGFSSSSSCSSSSSPCSCPTSSVDSPTPSGSSSDPPADLGARPKASPASHHKRSVSMTSLPLYNRQVADSCIVRVSVDLGLNNGNLYKSILVGSSSTTGHTKHLMDRRYDGRDRLLICVS